MESWVIGTKFIILLYSIICYVKGDMIQIPLVILSILAYVCFSMLHYIFKSKIIKRSMLFLTCIFLTLSAFLINPLFIFLLPISMIELAASYTEDLKAWALFAVLPVAFCNVSRLPEYFLTAGLSFTLYMLSARMYAYVSTLKEDNEKLKEKNEALLGRLDVGVEYENQLKYLTQMEERNSLAQKIHDKVGHTIAGSLIQLEAASLMLDKDQNMAREMLSNVVNHLKDGMESIRSTLRNIKPAPEQLGINRLKVMLDEFSVNNPIRTSLNYNGSLEPITHTQWKIIMDNTREALTNTSKYGAASSVKVDVQVLNRLVRAEVCDNGLGACSYRKGLGIVGMEERTENAGGKLIIDGSKGFSIIMLLPVSEVANADKSNDSR